MSPSRFQIFSVLTTASLITLVGFFSATANAYIPSSRTIAIRTAKNNGKGAYAIDQDVQFRAGSESVTLRERWIVQDGETMRVTVTSASNPALHFDAAYRAGKKSSPDTSGNVKTSAIPTEFIERYAHARTSNDLLQSFVRSGIVPQSFLQERARFNPNSKTQNTAEPHVRLARTNGVITWAFGIPSPADGSKALPGAWIEQDGFSIRRLRFPSEAELSANQYALQGGNFMYPRERTVTWNGNTAVIRLVSIKSVDASAVATAMALGSPAAARLPDQANVKEFYSRFR